MAAHLASEAALRLVKPGNETYEVTDTVAKIAEAFNCKVSFKSGSIPITSVSDPSHFDMDPDPDPRIHIWEKWIRILGSTFGKSGSGSGSKVDPDPSTYF